MLCGKQCWRAVSAELLHVEIWTQLYYLFDLYLINRHVISFEW
jgi:hypothetical protein